MMKRLRTASLAATVFALAALPALAQETTPWLRIQAQDDSDKTKIEVNLPLAAVEALGEMDAIGERIRNEIAEEWERDTDLEVEPDDLRAFWRSLRENPGAWVTVDEEGGGSLRARMDGDEVRIEGGDGEGSLDIRFPAAFGDALFGADGEPDLGAAIRSLATHEDVLVSLGGEDGRVRVWVESR